MPTIHLNPKELKALQKKLGHDTQGALRGVIKKIDEAVKAQDRLDNLKYNDINPWFEDKFYL